MGPRCVLWTVLGFGSGVLGACADGDDSRVDATLGGTTTFDPSDSSGGGGACVPGAQVECPCPGGVQGVQVCREDGSGFETCQCGGGGGDASASESSDGGGDSTSAGDPCGDGTCAADEDCNSCEADCGACEPCTLAPSCEGAEIPPVIDVHAEFLDDPMAWVPPHELAAQLRRHIDEGSVEARLIAAALSPAQADEPPFVTELRGIFAQHEDATAALRRQLALAGMDAPEDFRAAHPVRAAQVSVADLAAAVVSPAATADGGLTGERRPTAAPCDDPRLRVRVARLDVHEEDDDFANDEVYCAITSEASSASEIKITPKTGALDEGDSYTYPLEGGVVWGQGGPEAPKGNLLITYNCIESDTAEGYANLVMAVGMAAQQAGALDIPGVDGWVFPAVGVVANVLSGALALDGDDQLFNASQVIPEDQHVPLTTGAWWSVRRTGTHINSDWDWELRMEIWGCHDNAG